MHPAGSIEIPLLSTLSADEQNHILSCMTLIELPPGAVIFQEGDCGDSLYIIVSGEVEILKAIGTHEEHCLAVPGPGDFFGEVALLDTQGSRSATARTRSQAVLLQMTAADFNLLMQTRPALALQMTHLISSRLRAASNATIRDLEAKNRTLAQAYHDLKEAQNQIVEKEKLEKELEIARGIQRSMLPERLPEVPGYSFGAHMRAARWLGGDFYDLFPLDDERIAIAIGDVSDKGVPAALFMALTRSLLRAEALRQASPADTLRRVNALLLDMSASDQFVTVLFGVLHPAGGSFTYARAGHELPILVRADGNLAAIPTGTGMVLGVLDEIAIDEGSLALAPGDTLLLFSDGVTDAANRRGERFGHERMAQAILAGPRRPAQAACDQLLAAILAYQDGAAQFDDITLLTVCAED